MQVQYMIVYDSKYIYSMVLHFFKKLQQSWLYIDVSLAWEPPHILPCPL